MNDERGQSWAVEVLIKPTGKPERRLVYLTRTPAHRVWLSYWQEEWPLEGYRRRKSEPGAISEKIGLGAEIRRAKAISPARISRAGSRA